MEMIKKNIGNDLRYRRAKKFTSVLTVALMTVVLGCAFAMPAFAAEINTSGFISTAVSVLKALVILVGAGIAVYGVINLLESYGEGGSPAGKSQGIKQLMAGLAIIIVALLLVPELETMMNSATAAAGTGGTT